MSTSDGKMLNLSLYMPNLPVMLSFSWNQTLWSQIGSGFEKKLHFLCRSKTRQENRLFNLNKYYHVMNTLL